VTLQRGVQRFDSAGAMVARILRRASIWKSGPRSAAGFPRRSQGFKGPFDHVTKFRHIARPMLCNSLLLRAEERRKKIKKKKNSNGVASCPSSRENTLENNPPSNRHPRRAAQRRQVELHDGQRLKTESREIPRQRGFVISRLVSPRISPHITRSPPYPRLRVKTASSKKTAEFCLAAACHVCGLSRKIVQRRSSTRTQVLVAEPVVQRALSWQNNHFPESVSGIATQMMRTIILSASGDSMMGSRRRPAPARAFTPSTKTRASVTFDSSFLIRPIQKRPTQ